jgi:cytochrome P450
MPVPFRPSPASAPVYLATRGTWILSRHADVSCALTASELSQPHITSPQQEAADHVALKAAVQADIDRLSAEQWRCCAENSLDEVVASAARRKCPDLLADIIQPWTTRMVASLNAKPDPNQRIDRISKELLLAAVTNSKRRRKLAEQAVDRMIQDRSLVVSRPMFFGFTQTLSSYLAKAWLALLLNPERCEQLLASHTLAANATGELLRYAGIVHTIHRTANTDVQVGAAHIREGQTVMLEIDSANFDPERFENPDQLDFTRRSAGQLALGRGLHACVGVQLVRMASQAALQRFLRAGFVLDVSRQVLWTGDRTLLWPFAVPVKMSR